MTESEQADRDHQRDLASYAVWRFMRQALSSRRDMQDREVVYHAAREASIEMGEGDRPSPWLLRQGWQAIERQSD